MRKKLEAQKAEEARRSGVALNGSTNGMPLGDDVPGKTSMTLFDATIEEDMLRKSQEHRSRPRATTLDKGFNDMTLSPSGTLAQSSYAVDPQAAVKVLANVRSIRGMARQEYGKVYGALAPFYYDLEGQEVIQTLFYFGPTAIPSNRLRCWRSSRYLQKVIMRKVGASARRN